VGWVKRILIITGLLVIVGTSLVVGLYLWRYDFNRRFVDSEYYGVDFDQEVFDPQYYVFGGELPEDFNRNWTVADRYNHAINNYRIGRITYDEFIIEVVNVLSVGSPTGIIRQPGMLWGAMVDHRSRYRLWVQDSLFEEVSTVFLVRLDEPTNSVRIIHSGTKVDYVEIINEGESIRFIVQNEEQVIQWGDLPE
jgi:hypothetical protein